MENELPEPPVAADIDLRDFAFLPVDVVRLRDSDLAATASGDGFRAAVLGWAAAWHQVPAGSLPGDDRKIAHLLGFGRDVASFRAVRDEAMHGWVLCSDGRWYHPTVCEKAREAWEKKTAYRAAKEADAARKREARKSKGQDERSPTDVHEMSGGRPSDIQETSDGNPLHKGHGQKIDREMDSPPLPPAGGRLDDGVALDEAVRMFNATAERAGLPTAMKMNDQRRAKLRQRLKDAGGLDGWRVALEKLAASPHCTGQNDRGWRADLDFLLQDRSFTRLMEGSYDARRPASAPPQHNGQAGWKYSAPTLTSFRK